MLASCFFLLLKFAGIDIWFQSPRDISASLLEYYEAASRTGRRDLAMIALRLAWRFKFLGGENLSLIQQKHDERLEELVRAPGPVVPTRLRFVLLTCFFPPRPSTTKVQLDLP